jgi:NosR/NirI family nitrous oxide reductase transcriptional regulator
LKQKEQAELSANQISTAKRVKGILAVLAVISLIFAWVYGRFAAQIDREKYLRGAAPGAATYQRVSAGTHERAYVFKVLDGQGTPLGYVTLSEGQGYGGPMEIVVFWSPGGTIRSLRIAEHREDEPWYRHIEDKEFLGQFVGRRDTDPLELDRDVNAVSGATCSSHGITEAIQKGRAAVAKQLGHVIPARKTTEIKFKPADAVLMLILGLLVLFRTVPRLRKIPHRRIVALFLGFLVLGLWLNQPLSLANFATWMLGYVPSWRTSIFPVVLVLAIPAMTLFMGKNFYCLWLCPFSAVQEAAHKITGINVRPGPGCGQALKKVRYTLLWLLLLLAFLARNPSVTIYEPWAALFTLKGAAEQWILVGVTLIGAMVVKNYWCYYLCSVGTLLEILIRIRESITRRFIPLVIIAFRKKDGGISGCSKKSVPKPERFFDNRYKSKKAIAR